MTTPTSWKEVAFNQATESENRIHADDVAKQYGFRGGLVPGVTVHAYLVHPALVAWGAEWLARGRATVALKKPLYDGSAFRVEVRDADAHAYRATLVDAEGTECATADVELPRAGLAPAGAPPLRGDRAVPPRDACPPATLETMQRLQREGMGALRMQWRCEGNLDRYTRETASMPALVQPEGQGYANPAYVLGLANWVLARNVVLGPWIHVESTLQHHAALARDAWVTVEASIVELFEARGNRFVDLAVSAHGDAGPIMHARHRAIYELRRR